MCIKYWRTMDYHVAIVNLNTLHADLGEDVK